mgnify:CR=1 FL=1
MIQMTYQKANGEIIQRIVNTYTPYNIGDTTSMGWYVKDKRYRYKNKYYSRADYDTLIDKSYKWNRKTFNYFFFNKKRMIPIVIRAIIYD